MPLVRGINQLCVTRRAPSLVPIQWPAEVYRGGSLPEEHVQFFKDRIDAKIRMKTFFATSTKKATAAKFISPCTLPWRVLWTVRFDPDYSCLNVNYLETVTTIAGEHEFLFPPYSVFTIKKVERDDTRGMHTIEIEAAFDNKAEPLELEVAPWG